MDDRDFKTAAESILASESWKQEGFRLAFRPFFYQEKGSDGLQYTHTPFSLCKEIISKLGEYAKIKRKGIRIAVLFNLEFVDVLINDFGADCHSITFFADSEREAHAAKAWYGAGIGGIIGLKGKGIDMPKVAKKFDVVVMNPPYQAPQTIRNDKGLTGGGSTLWDKFLKLATELGDTVCSVNPSGWRTPQHALLPVMRKGLRYLEMHSHKDGQKMFGKGTRYDIIIWDKDHHDKCLVVDESGEKQTLDIANWSFLPNHSLDLFGKLIAKPGEERINLLHSYSFYETRKTWMSNEQKGKFQHPCVYMINAKNEPTYFWSSKQEEHFGVPKVIFATGCSSGFMLDVEGKYGLTQFARGVVDSPKNLPKIYETLNSERWRTVRSALFIAENSVSKDAFACLRKDFWKEFV